jgi:4-hydroxybenzoate polyprenyltransferase
VSARDVTSGEYFQGTRRARSGETKPRTLKASTSYVGRISLFFRERIQLGRHFMLAALIYLGVAGYVSVVHDWTMTVRNSSTIVGVASLFCLMLMLRLMDEIKDSDTDRKLFPDRPLPSGRVHLRDLQVTLGLVILLYLAINLAFGLARWTAIGVLGYALLMFRFFFVPRLIRRSLLLGLLTHNPIVPLMLLHCVAVASAGHGHGPAELRWDLMAPFVVMMWAPLLAWEVSRKIRAPAEETEYVTYSRVLGLGGAICFALAVQAIATLIDFWLFAKLGFSLVVPAIAAVALVASWAAHRRLLLEPGDGSRRLSLTAQGFALALFAGQFYAFVWPAPA